jgi:uncharacterized OB-fold protein
VPHKPRQSEEEFFAREEAEKKHVLHETHQRQISAHERDERRKLHFMKCPKCGDNLSTIRIGFVDVEQCPDCGAMVLDRGELEKIRVAESGLLKSFMEVFRNT